MRTFLLVVVLSCCSNTFANSPDFIRGDFNGDGSVNFTDVVAMGNWLGDINNYPGPAWPADRADVNDDGVVDVSDVAALGNYLFGGGAAPASPFPNEGHDCTGDDLAPCTSPANGNITMTAGNSDATVPCTGGVAEWSNFAQVTYGGPGEAEFYYSNFSNCSHASTCNTGFASWDVTDGVTFTECELEDNVMDVFVTQAFDHEFIMDTTCGSGYCPTKDILAYSAKVLVDVQTGTSTPIVVEPAGVSWSADQEYCGDNSGNGPGTTITKNITQDILDAIQPAAGDCDEWKIVRYTILVTVQFAAGGGDTAIRESILVDTTGSIYYSCAE